MKIVQIMHRKAMIKLEAHFLKSCSKKMIDLALYLNNTIY